MNPTIEYIENDRLIYADTDAGRYPIAFAGSGIAYPVPFMNFSDMGFVLSACEKAWTYKQPQTTYKSVSDHLVGDLLKIFNIRTKRVCYFCQENGRYIRIAKVENIKRNNSPENVLGVWNLDTQPLPADELRALRAIIAGGYTPMTRFGYYIPVNLAKRIVADIKPSESNEPIEKVVVDEPDIFASKNSPRTTKPLEPNTYIKSEEAIKPLTINSRTILI